MLKNNPDKIVLGCTHYPYLLETLSLFAPKELFIDPAQIFVDFIKNNLNKNDSNTLGTEEFFVSATPELFINNAKLFYSPKTLPKIIKV